MGYYRPHRHDILRLRAPYEQSQIVVQRYNKLAELVAPYCFDAHTLRKLLTLFIYLNVLFIVVLAYIFLMQWRRLRKFSHQRQSIQVNDFHNGIVPCAHNSILINVHAGGLRDHEINTFLQLILLISMGYHAQKPIGCEQKYIWLVEAAVNELFGGKFFIKWDCFTW